MDQTKTNSAPPEEFTFDRKKIIANLMDLIPKMKDLREKAEVMLPTMKKPKLEVESLAGIIKGTEWIEREINELLGVTFKNHPNMIHLILPEDWPKGNYPLRRDQ